MSGHAFACFPFVLAMSFAWQSALAEEFSLMIGSPVAAQSFGSKTSVFVFRSKGCPEPAKLQVGGTAEGFVGSARRTVRLSRIAAMPTPGVFAVHREWPVEGVWLVSLTGHCADSTAGALIPIGAKGFSRASSRFFPRAATEAEIEASLKALAADNSEAAK
ncbi:MAG: hypothetical protein ACKV22_26450 [Bryobacteraceae bacterium]